jgi:uncharacterized membrane protein
MLGLTCVRTVWHVVRTVWHVVRMDRTVVGWASGRDGLIVRTADREPKSSIFHAVQSLLRVLWIVESLFTASSHTSDFVQNEAKILTSGIWYLEDFFSSLFGHLQTLLFLPFVLDYRKFLCVDFIYSVYTCPVETSRGVFYYCGLFILCLPLVPLRQKWGVYVWFGPSDFRPKMAKWGVCYFLCWMHPVFYCVLKFSRPDAPVPWSGCAKPVMEITCSGRASVWTIEPSCPDDVLIQERSLHENNRSIHFSSVSAPI